MADHGGYRRPAHPAPVSGPGAHARRTDGGPAQVASTIPDQAYGQRSADLAAQQAVPMGGSTPLPKPAQPAPQGGQQMPTAPPYQGGDFLAPTSRPDEPITAGADFGPGPGSSILNVATPSAATGTGQMTQLLENLSSTDTTGILGTLLIAARNSGA